MIDLTVYEPNELEVKINYIYQSQGICSTSDLSIENVAAIFHVDLPYYTGPSFADWDDPDNPVIFIDSRLDIQKKREIFFHEVSHLLLHVGNQNELPGLFKELQENQAGYCQLYAAMPIYMFEEFQGLTHLSCIEAITNRFMLPSTFVRKRLEQINRRISRTQWDQQIKAQIQSQYRKTDPSNYSQETKKILAKLYRQLNSKGSLNNG
jgi:Zn-dependent peptidase ImmA (M78 family)